DEEGGVRRLSQQEAPERVEVAARVVDAPARVAAVRREVVNGPVAHRVEAALERVQTLRPGRSVAEGHEVLIESSVNAPAAVGDAREVGDAQLRLPEGVERDRADDRADGADVGVAEAD